MLLVVMRVEKCNADVPQIERHDGRQREKPLPVFVHVVEYKHTAMADMRYDSVAWRREQAHVYVRLSDFACNNSLAATGLYVFADKRHSVLYVHRMWLYAVGDAEQQMQTFANPEPVSERKTGVK